MLFKIPQILKTIYPSLVWDKKTDEKVIYLTFDDGPIPEVTEFVLDTLAEHNAKATFFCIGDNVRKHPEVFDLISNNGHAIGNHTFNHLKGWETENEVYFENIEQCQQRIQKSTKALLFRPPYGRIKKSQIAGLKDQFQIIMWSVLTQDYRQDLNPETCLQKSIQATNPGSIVVFHDSLKARKNLEYVLPKYVAHFKQEGYQFLSL